MIGPPTNTGTIFSIGNRKSSSREDLISNEKIIVRSRPINAELPLAKDRYEYPVLDGQKSHLIDGIESQERTNNNRIRPLFESNRLLPVLLGRDANDGVTSKRCYRIAPPSS